MVAMKRWTGGEEVWVASPSRQKWHAGIAQAQFTLKLGRILVLNCRKRPASIDAIVQTPVALPKLGMNGRVGGPFNRVLVSSFALPICADEELAGSRSGVGRSRSRSRPSRRFEPVAGCPRFACGLWTLTWGSVRCHSIQARRDIAYFHAARPATFSPIPAFSLSHLQLLPATTQVQFSRHLRPLYAVPGGHAAALWHVHLRFRVMPEHVHLLVSEPTRDTLADAMHFLKLAFAKRRPAVPQVRGHFLAPNLDSTDSRPAKKPTPFWQPRYYDRNVRGAREFKVKLRYLHRNPVSRGLVHEALDWKWSSFRHYALREKGVVEIESQWTAADRETQAAGRAPRIFLRPDSRSPG